MENFYIKLNEIKSKIKGFIEKNQLEYAHRLIDDYISQIPDDIEIYSMKAVVLILEGNLGDAEKVLKLGLSINKNNFDLNYNLAYICEIQQRYYEALLFYIVAKENNNNYDMINEIENRISSIKELLDINDKNYDFILCGSNINKNILQSLKKIGNIKGSIETNDLEVEKELVSIIKWNEIKNLNYDYIIIMENDIGRSKKIIERLKKYNVNFNKVYNYCDYNLPIEGFEYKLYDFFLKDKVELLVTGLSYAETGIDCKYLDISACNFALSSQDLFYDYNILKYLLQFKDKMSNLKYVIIGLSYYSFDYDLSKSSEAIRIHRYWEFIKDIHNHTPKLSININKSLYRAMHSKEDYNKMMLVKMNTVMYNENAEVQQYIAKHHAAMCHLETVKENKIIFKNYLELLKSINIKPIIVVFPTSNYHYKFFEDGVLKKRFYNILEEFSKEYNLKIFDYFKSDLFDYNDFWDYSHLNKNGAKKMTEILNNIILNK
ncbi:hypothetical protein CF055_07765 [Clostridium botulinum]|uniref:hypothetical protein n=1 Tax=Clostridium botulinum TaxID=1491 RepID=UPI000A16F46D|nr:hypothetical protein [Clostridium botulinum]AUM88668.1 hypothetical protein RSJ15_13500 [Clostridium botulinum]NFO70256.1 hypothetical protein [Clostridium botulinum]OSB14027.1 hypothetical protein B2H96_05250 [Clostridium botulinum]